MKQFDTVEMANGGVALVLEPTASREKFLALSQKWVALLNAMPLATPIMSADECLVEVKIADGEFCITYDDFQRSIQLEPKEAIFNRIILELQKNAYSS